MERSQRHIVILSLAWVVAHVLLAAVLDAPLWASSRSGRLLPEPFAFWAAGAMAVQTPFLMARAGIWRRWPWWLVGWGGVTLLNVVIVYPFALGVSFSCRAQILGNSVCTQWYLLASLAPVGLLVGAFQWALLRRSAQRAGWLPLAQLIGVIALTLAFTTARYDLRFLAASTMAPALPHMLAGIAYALVMLPALLILRPRRGTVSASTLLELPDDDPDSAASPP